MLAFPYDARSWSSCATIPHRRFDWDTREWSAPAEDWTGIEGRRGARALSRADRRATRCVAWLAGVERRWVGYVAHDALRRPRLVGARHPAGSGPRGAARGRGRARGQAARAADRQRPPQALREQRSARLDAAAERCLSIVELGEMPPPGAAGARPWRRGRAAAARGGLGPGRRARRSSACPAPRAAARCRSIPWIAEQLDAFIARHDVEVTGAGRARRSTRLLAERREAADAIRRSRAEQRRADRGDRRPCSAASWRPFQWAGVRYVARRPPRVPGRRAGPGQDGRGARGARGRRRLPGDRRLPGVDEARLAARGGEVAAAPVGRRRRGTRRRSRRAATSRSSTTRSSPPTARRWRAGARARSSSTSRTTARTRAAKRTQAVRRLAGAVAPDGLRLALTGTPVLNHAEELIAQLRVIGRLEDFGSGAQLLAPVPRRAERGAAALASAPSLLRAPAEVRRAAPAARQAPGRRARSRSPTRPSTAWPSSDVIEWLRSQPLDLSELNARIAADAAGRAPGSARYAPAPRRARQARGGARVDRGLPGLRRAARRVRAPRRGPAGGAARASPTRCTCSARDSLRAPRGRDRGLPGPRRPVADRRRDAGRGPGHHAHARVQRRLPRARVDARDARPGRGSLPPDRPARRRHRLVPARRRHDRRDDGAADPEQARDRRRRHRRSRCATTTGSSQAVIRELRDGRPFQHLRVVGEEPGGAGPAARRRPERQRRVRIYLSIYL